MGVVAWWATRQFAPASWWASLPVSFATLAWVAYVAYEGWAWLQQGDSYGRSNRFDLLLAWPALGIVTAIGVLSLAFRGKRDR